MNWFAKRGDPSPDGHRPAGPVPPAPSPAEDGPDVAAHSSYAQHDVDQCAGLSTTPMPYDVESTHEPVIVHATAAVSLTLEGPTPGPNPSAVLAEVLEDLGRQASARGCVRVWSIQHTMTVDAGVLFISAIGTGSRPITNLDEAPPGSRA